MNWLQVQRTLVFIQAPVTGLYHSLAKALLPNLSYSDPFLLTGRFDRDTLAIIWRPEPLKSEVSLCCALQPLLPWGHRGHTGLTTPCSRNLGELWDRLWEGFKKITPSDRVDHTHLAVPKPIKGLVLGARHLKHIVHIDPGQGKPNIGRQTQATTSVT